MMKVPCRRGLCILLVVLGCALAGTVAQAATQPATQPAPRLVVRTLAGKTFNLAAERGKWVIVNFWATWCGPCIAEMPAISKFVAAHKDVAAIGLAWDDSARAEVVKFARKHPVDYPLAQVSTARAPAGFATPQALPTTYLIAPDGSIAQHFLGPVDAKILSAAIAADSAKGGGAKTHGTAG